jgi:hypothetical protein
MLKQEKNIRMFGAYQGVIAPEYESPDLVRALADLPACLASPDAVPVSIGRNKNVRIVLPLRQGPAAVMVKAFGCASLPGDLRAQRMGGKAWRTWRAATFLSRRGVGTPPPVACLERWAGLRLRESYFISVFQPDLVSFKDELSRLFREEPECEKFMDLSQAVADAVRGMHDAGFWHGDLGNQNIMMRRTADGWRDVQFVDLNRGRICAALSLRRRARDLSRIYLPSDFLRVFMEMYFNGPVPPRSFKRWQNFYRALYAVHHATRVLRHPLRERRLRLQARPEDRYPREKDMWVWDERSGQPVNVLTSRDRRRHHAVGDHLRIAFSASREMAGIQREFRKLVAGSFKQPVPLAGRIGMTIDPQPATGPQELAHLAGLGRIPVLLRFCHHQPPARWEYLAGVAADLRRSGHAVSVALVQDRRAVLQPESWIHFAGTVLDMVGPSVAWVEAGHAVNRVKWGIWTRREYRRLMEGLSAVAQKHPGVRWVGPAVNDFEYMPVIDNLKQSPLSYWGLSHHLYVDRRGPPEQAQHGFAALQKFALARAIAHRAPNCGDRVIISEVNWPLLGMGVHSPVGAPYVAPGPRYNDPSVSEDLYADYMLRYLLIAMASGMVDQVFWWRLVARGYGLIDDTDPHAWRLRPAYRVLKTFLSLLGESTFIHAQVMVPGVQEFSFKTPDGRSVTVVYSWQGAREMELPFAYEQRLDALGVEQPPAPRVRMDGRPAYFIGRFNRM